MGLLEVQYKQASRTESRRDFLRRVGVLGIGLVAQAGVAEAAGFMSHIDARSAYMARVASLPARERQTAVPAQIDINQVGFLPWERKRAVVAASAPIPGNGFNVVDADAPHHRHYGGTLAACSAVRDIGDESLYFYANFDRFDKPGRYRLRLSDGGLSDPFSIGGDLYENLIPLTLQFFTMQTCGADCHDLHGICHRDDGIISGGPRDGQPIDCSGGWHDAGDYLKFVETTSYVTALMLFTCDRFPHLAAQAHHGEPSPLLAQARVGAEWLLKMHPAPDEFYYQVGDATDHDRWRLPDQDNADRTPNWRPRRVLFGVGANLAGRTAAALALASRVLAHHDAPFAARCLTAARSAYRLGQSHPSVLTTEPYDFYPETTWEDDMAWGAAELYRATGRPDYLAQGLEFAHHAGASGDPTSVYNTHALAHYTLYSLAPEADRERLRRYLRDDATRIRDRANNVYGLGTPYIWGTAEGAAGAALTCLLYAHVDESSNDEYLDVARYNRDFILGCNSFGISNLIGAGARYPHNPHHQVANLRGVELTGALVGGPAPASVFREQKITQAERDMVSGTALIPDLPGRTVVYHDEVQDYVTNEPAIDYTSKFLLLSAFYNSKTRGESET